MKICVFSDIHGNGPAFRVAYPMILNEKADINIFLGDLCGYYFNQKEIFYMLKTIPNFVALRGNHDDIFIRIINNDEEIRKFYLKKYGASMENMLVEDVSDLFTWLLSLPGSFTLTQADTKAFHGSPWDPLEGYVYPDSPLLKFSDYPASFVLLGHTHYPMARVINEKLIVNPGSLGQPRDGNWPTYALVDSSSKSVVFKQVHYDKTELIKQIDRIDGCNQYLKEIIFR